MSGATYTYKLKADSGYQSEMTGSITPDRHGVVCAVLAGLVPDDAGIAKEAGDLLAALEDLVNDHGFVSYQTAEEKESDPYVKAARSVIARARGES